ncbi:MAG: hypothetical protein V1898_04150 [Patescibacteria group bacterium]
MVSSRFLRHLARHDGDVRLAKKSADNDRRLAFINQRDRKQAALKKPHQDPALSTGEQATDLMLESEMLETKPEEKLETEREKTIRELRERAERKFNAWVNQHGANRELSINEKYLLFLACYEQANDPTNMEIAVLRQQPNLLLFVAVERSSANRKEFSEDDRQVLRAIDPTLRHAQDLVNNHFYIYEDRFLQSLEMFVQGDLVIMNAYEDCLPNSKTAQEILVEQLQNLKKLGFREVVSPFMLEGMVVVRDLSLEDRKVRGIDSGKWDNYCVYYK